MQVVVVVKVKSQGQSQCSMLYISTEHADEFSHAGLYVTFCTERIAVQMTALEENT